MHTIGGQIAYTDGPNQAVAGEIYTGQCFQLQLVLVHHLIDTTLLNLAGRVTSDEGRALITQCDAAK